MNSAAICEKGPVRETNQDAVLVCRENDSGLFIVADGVGSMKDGSIVSSLVTSRFKTWWECGFLPHYNDSFFDNFERIQKQAEDINAEAVMKYELGESASTLALLFIHKNMYGVIGVGDSRIYVYDRSGLRQITRDDNVMNLPGLTEEVNAKKLISAVGITRQLEYSTITDAVRQGDVFMVCSDGAYGFISEEEMSSGMRVVRTFPFLLKNRLKQMETTVIGNHSSDNYSMILIRI